MVLVLAPVVSTFAPGALSAASERLLSLNQYGSDDSVRYRLQEGRHVIDKIQAHPFVGWGLADEIFYGLPWLQTPPTAESFAHNGYLWLSWKLGIPGALLLFAVIAWAIAARPPPGLDPLARVRAPGRAGVAAPDGGDQHHVPQLLRAQHHGRQRRAAGYVPGDAGSSWRPCSHQSTVSARHRPSATAARPSGGPASSVSSRPRST